MTTDSAGIVTINSTEVKNLIYTVREKQVMLDSDLAQLYQVETKQLNRAAKRNQDRSPDDFRFQLTPDELDRLRCQIGTSWPDLHEFGTGGRRNAPFVYTEQGIAMLSGVLHSEVAVQASVQIMRAFVEMRHFIANNALLFEQVREVELRQREFERNTDGRFERVFDYMGEHEIPSQRIFFEGQVYDAFELLTRLIGLADQHIVLVDGYVDTATLNILAKKRDGVSADIWTHPHVSLSQRDVDLFNEQYPLLAVHHTTAFHDRFLILDNTRGYFVGASLKDAGKKCFAITRIEDSATVESIISRLPS